MSVQAMAWVLDHSPSRGYERLVLLSLANHAHQSPAGDAWEAYPGIGTIQREAGIERKRTVQDVLARLVEGGAVERVINGAPDGRIRQDRRPNLYRILLANGVTCGDTRCRWCDPPRGDVSRHHGVTFDDATGCRQTSPEPSVEPSLEPLGLFADDATPRQSRGKEPKTRTRARIDPDFAISLDMRRWARDKGIRNAALNHQHERFVAYWVGRGEPKASWEATWRSWMLKEFPPAPDDAASPEPGVTYR